MRAFGLSLLLLVSGCSFLFVESPPPPVHARQRDFDCTSSRLAPIVDTVVATAYGLTGVGMAALAAGGEARDEGVPMVLLPLGVAALFGVSAAHGFSTTSACEDAKARSAGAVPSAPPPRPAPSTTCGRDTDCPGTQICDRGACVIVSLPAPPTRPAEAPPPAEPAPRAPASSTPLLEPPAPAATPAASPPAPGP